MDRRSSELTIYIVPDGVALDELVDYSPEEMGNIMSSADNLNVNKVEDGYSVIFPASVLITAGPQFLINNIVRIFNANLPGVKIDVSLVYAYETEDDEDDFFDMTVAQAVMMFDVMFYKILGTNPAAVKNFTYYRSQSVIETAETYQDIMEGNDGDDEEEDEGDEFGYDPSEIGYGQYGDPMAALNRALRGYAPDDDDDDEDDRRHKRRHSSYYGGFDSSRVLNSAKNPKRAYHRHGVIVARNKNAIKKDVKIIKSFLKEFIPGNAGWKKDLRDDLAKRWIRVYAVTSKQLRKLEKQHRKMMEDQYRPKINTERTLALTRQIFSVPVDNWSNPNK